MNLFLDTISPKNTIILFDDERKIIKKYFFDVRQNESTLLIDEFDNFLKDNNLTYFDLENIVVVNGPGSFTGVRTTVLFVNSINFITKKNITNINYFELFSSFPIIKSSSKRDVFYKKNSNSQIEIISNDEVTDKVKNDENIYGDITFLTDKNIISLPDYDKIIKDLTLEKHKLIQPFYLKKPSIS